MYTDSNGEGNWTEKVGTQNNNKQNLLEYAVYFIFTRWMETKVLQRM